jgi:hypothetical protein
MARMDSWMKIAWVMLVVAAMGVGCETATVDNQGTVSLAELQGIVPEPTPVPDTNVNTDDADTSDVASNTDADTDTSSDSDADADTDGTGTSTNTPSISSSGSAGPWDGTGPSMKVRQIPPRSVSVTTEGIIDSWPPSGAKGARAILTVDGHRADYMTPGLLRGSPRVPEGLYTKWDGGPVRKGQTVSIGLKPFSGNGRPISVKVIWILEPVN